MSDDSKSSNNFCRLNNTRYSVNLENTDNDETLNNNAFSCFSNYEKAKIISNYLELSCLEYTQTKISSDLNNCSDSNISNEVCVNLFYKERPLFLIMSCWKLMWCLTMNELIGEVLRYKIETGRAFNTEKKNGMDNSKFLSVPEMTEGEIPRYIMAYSHIFRVVLGVLRWLRWESRVNPEKQDDILIKDKYFIDYEESRILNKNMNRKKRFYHLDWGILSEVINNNSISKRDYDNIEEVFKISYLLLRKGCRMQLDTFLQDKAKANWIICLIDGMDAYLNADIENDYYVDLSHFLEILPKVDDMWLNENDDEDDESSIGKNKQSTNYCFMKRINRDLTLNDTLFKESFEFLDLIERCLIFPSIDDIKGSSPVENDDNLCINSPIIEGNINRVILYHFLKKVVNHNDINNKVTYSADNIGNWEKTFYSLLCGDFNSLYVNSKDDYDKLFALFNTRKINIFNNWSDFFESNTQKGRNGIYRGKCYPFSDIYDSIYKKVEFLVKDIYSDIKSEYVVDDFEDIQEFNSINNFQKSCDLSSDFIYTNDYYGINEQHIYYNDGCSSIINDMNETEKQFIDSLIDSMSCINTGKNEKSLDSLFFNIQISIISSFLNPNEYRDKLINSLDELLNFLSEINGVNSQNLSYTGSVRAFLAQIIASHTEITNTFGDNINNYKAYFFDEHLINISNNNHINIPNFELDIHSTVKFPFLLIPEHITNKFVSQYLDYIIESKKDNSALDIFLLMLEYTSQECRVSYIREIILKNRNSLNILDFQRVVYNLITQFPSEFIKVVFDFIENNIYNRVGDNNIANAHLNDNNNSGIFSLIVLDTEFIILTLGTIFQFLISRQDYIPTVDTVYKVVKEINFIKYYNNNSNDSLFISLTLLEKSILSDDKCNQTIYEVIIGIYILSEINNLLQLLFTLEIIDLIGFKENLESIQDYPFLLYLKRANICLNEFVIPMVLEPIIIRLFTVIASNINNNIEPKYINYKIKQILESNNFLQAISWENNIIYLISICEYIKVNNLLITLVPIKNIISQINYFKALNLVRNYQDLINDFKDKVDSINTVDRSTNINNNISYSHIQNGSSIYTKNYSSNNNSPRSSLLVSPQSIQNLSSSRHNSQRRNSLQLNNIEKQIETIEFKIKNIIQDIEYVLADWFISIPEKLFGNSNINDNKVHGNKFDMLNNFSSYKSLFGYCEFPVKHNFTDISFNNAQVTRYNLLELSKSTNIQRLVDQLVFTIVFHYDVSCYYRSKLNLHNNRKSFSGSNDEDDEKPKNVSLSFLDNILKFMDNSDWILKIIKKSEL